MKCQKIKPVNQAQKSKPKSCQIKRNTPLRIIDNLQNILNQKNQESESDKSTKALENQQHKAKISFLILDNNNLLKQNELLSKCIAQKTKQNIELQKHLSQLSQVRIEEKKSLCGCIKKFQSNQIIQNNQGSKFIKKQVNKHFRNDQRVGEIQNKLLIQDLKMKNLQLSEIIHKLETQIKQITSESLFAQEKLRLEIMSLKEEIGYKQEQFQRQTDNLIIKAEVQLQRVMNDQQNKSEKENILLKQSIYTLQLQISQKNSEIIRLNQKVKNSRAYEQQNIRYLETKNSQLQSEVQIITSKMKRQERQISQKLKAIYEMQIQIMREKYGQEIKLLIQRINNLSKQIENKNMQIKEAWETRSKMYEKKLKNQSSHASQQQIKKEKSICFKNKAEENFHLVSLEKYLKTK